MKVILTHEVTGLGTAGDVVDVKDGYARNFLLRRGLATGWTKGVAKQVAAPVTVVVKAGKSGRLFGAVTQGDVADAVKAAGGPELDRRKVELTSSIKSTGSYEALVRLHPEVQATIKLDVVAG